MMYALHGRVAELSFLDPDLVIGKLWMSEGREFVHRLQRRQMHRSHVPLQLRNTGKGPNDLLNIEALREGMTQERDESQQRPHGCGQVECRVQAPEKTLTIP
jgi:hypothetical protein